MGLYGPHDVVFQVRSNGWAPVSWAEKEPDLARLAHGTAFALARVAKAGGVPNSIEGLLETGWEFVEALRSNGSFDLSALTHDGSSLDAKQLAAEIESLLNRSYVGKAAEGELRRCANLLICVADVLSVPHRNGEEATA